jgi:hypothetical protein
VTIQRNAVYTSLRYRLLLGKCGLQVAIGRRSANVECPAPATGIGAGKTFPKTKVFGTQARMGSGAPGLYRLAGAVAIPGSPTDSIARRQRYGRRRLAGGKLRPKTKHL